jgi:hypothetical protein
MKKLYYLLFLSLFTAFVFISCSENSDNPIAVNNNNQRDALKPPLDDSLIFYWPYQVRLEWSGGSPDSLIDSTSSVGFNFSTSGLSKVRLVFISNIYNPYDTTGKIYIQLLNLDSINNPIVNVWKYGSAITCKVNQIIDLSYPRQGNFNLIAGILRSPASWAYPHRYINLSNIQLYKVY